VTKIYLPADAVAVALGANALAEALVRAGGIEIVRTGSRGMAWLEPLIEIDTPKGRIGYGPVSAADGPALLSAIASDGTHPKCIGLIDDHAWMKRQTRLTFARCGVIDPVSVEDYIAHDGFKGLDAALKLGPAKTIETVTKSGLRGRGGAGFPAGIKWKTAADAQADQKYIV
jgi:formate dehydrogenase iron-sulfur subunit